MIWIALACMAIAIAVAYLLGRRDKPSPEQKERPDDAISRLDQTIDDARALPLDDAVRLLEQRARTRERRRSGDPPVPR